MPPPHASRFTPRALRRPGTGQRRPPPRRDLPDAAFARPRRRPGRGGTRYRARESCASAPAAPISRALRRAVWPPGWKRRATIPSWQSYRPSAIGPPPPPSRPSVRKGCSCGRSSGRCSTARSDVAVHSFKDPPHGLPGGARGGRRAGPDGSGRRSPHPQRRRRHGRRGRTAAGAGRTRASAPLRSAGRRGSGTSARICVRSPLRGNVLTRIRRLREGRYDAILLAMAGVQRLRVSPLADAPDRLDLGGPDGGVRLDPRRLRAGSRPRCARPCNAGGRTTKSGKRWRPSRTRRARAAVGAERRLLARMEGGLRARLRRLVREPRRGAGTMFAMVEIAGEVRRETARGTANRRSSRTNCGNVCHRPSVQDHEDSELPTMAGPPRCRSPNSQDPAHWRHEVPRKAVWDNG